LQSEFTRLDDDKQSRVVAVEDITFGVVVEDDDVPIDITIPAKETHLVILASAAS
jgi:hypothetical protein